MDKLGNFEDETKPYWMDTLTYPDEVDEKWLETTNNNIQNSNK